MVKGRSENLKSILGFNIRNLKEKNTIFYERIVIRKKQ